MNKHDYIDVTLGDGLAVYFFVVVADLIAQIAFSFAIMPAQWFFGVNLGVNDYVNIAAMILLQGAFISVPLIYYSCKKKAAPRLKSPLCRPAPTDAFGVILPIIALICFYLPAAYFMVLLDKMGYNFSSGVNMDTPGKIILGAVAMVFCAPFVEELIFRGFLLGGLRERFHPYAAVVLSGIAFSLMHMNPEQTVYQFFLGCACGLIAVKSGRLLPAIIAHAANNAVAMLLEIPALGNAFNRMINFLTADTLAAVLSTVILFVAGLAAIYFICFGVEKLDKLRKKRKAGEETSVGESKSEESPDVAAPLSDKDAQPTSADPFEGYGAQPPKVAAPKKKKSGGAVALYFGGLGICLFMWLIVFASNLVLPLLSEPEATDLINHETTQTTEIEVNE